MKMKKGESCWDCKHLITRPHARPPVFCKAFPEGKGIPFIIMSGTDQHERLLGTEAEPVVFERKGAEE